MKAILSIRAAGFLACIVPFAVSISGCTNSAEDCAYTASCGTIAIDGGATGGSSGTSGSLGVCHACAADGDCASGTRANSVRCVPMNFKGTFHGYYCMTRSSVGSCSQPYTSLFSASSISGAAAESYCGIDQNLTTCEAVVDLSAQKSCTRANNCGSGSGDGLCQTLTAAPGLRCTIPCTTSPQCLSGQACSAPANGYCR